VNSNYFIVLALALMSSQGALAQQADIHDAFFHALQSPAGVYKGELKGDLATYLQRQAKTTVPVLISVTTLKTFDQPGCKRLQGEISMPGYTWKDAKTGAINSFSYKMAMNLCPDGSGPMPKLEKQAPDKQRAASQSNQQPLKTKAINSKIKAKP